MIKAKSQMNKKQNSQEDWGIAVRNLDSIAENTQNFIDAEDPEIYESSEDFSDT